MYRDVEQARTPEVERNRGDLDFGGLHAIVVTQSEALRGDLHAGIDLDMELF